MFSVMLRAAAAVVFLMLAANADAAESPGRYVLEKVQDGYLKLDTETGAVSLCAPKDGAWRCTGVPDDMFALTAENEKLKQRVEELEKSRFAATLPSDQDIDKLMNLFDKMVDRFVEMSRRIEREGTL
jgi:hypothetical protein